MKFPRGIAPFIPPISFFLTTWLIYMTYTNQWYLFIDNWFMSVTMMFGSFVAGATSEGGGAVAFPVMTLIFKIPPTVARNFSLAIQSVGMTSAAYIIFAKKIKIDQQYLILGSIGGIFGIIFGTYWIAPYVAPPYAKMFFVSLWLSFGVALFYLNSRQSRTVQEQIPPQMTLKGKLFLTILGFLGGIVTSIVGSGIDIVTFSVVTIRYRLSEKVATTTSVCLMAFNSLVGFALHVFILQDFVGSPEFNYWLVSIPVVIFGAPLGAYFISTRTRDFVSNFLYIILVIQFIGACWIMQPSGLLLIFSLSIFLGGLVFFLGFIQRHQKDNP